MRSKTRSCLCGMMIIIALNCCGSSTAQTDDEGPAIGSWPQWGGPGRNHLSLERGLLKEWPEAGPQLSWTFTATGSGYSSMAVASRQLFTLGTIAGKNVVTCLDANTGELLWQSELGSAADKDSYNQGWGGGPRSTPAVSGDRVVALDDLGRLGCLDRRTGNLLWQVDLVQDLGGSVPNWGYSESPLIDGERVIVCPGNKSFLVAIDVATGETLFTSSGLNERAHYVSVVKQDVKGIGSYVTATNSGLTAFSAIDGHLMWQKSGSGNATATIAMPIVQDRFVYHSSAYSAGCLLVEVDKVGDELVAKEIYANKVMQNHHGSVILVGENLFGVRKNGGMVCQDFLTGEMLWSERIPGESSASLTYADERLYVYGEHSGTCWLIEPSRDGWKEHGKVVIPKKTNLDHGKGKIWAHPVISDGKLFLRDQDLIFAFNVATN